VSLGPRKIQLQTSILRGEAANLAAACPFDCNVAKGYRDKEFFSPTAIDGYTAERRKTDRPSAGPVEID